MKTVESKLSPQEAIKLGQELRAAKPDNLVVGAFAAELVGEGYPFSKEMSKIVFDGYSDQQLGERFAEWCDKDGDLWS